MSVLKNDTYYFTCPRCKCKFIEGHQHNKPVYHSGQKLMFCPECGYTIIAPLTEGEYNNVQKQ